MTGWRIGYGGGPAPLVRAMEALQSHTSGNASSIAQHAAEVALRLTVEGDPAMTAERARFRAALLERRERVCAALAAMPGVSLVKPGGAFYVFADVSKHYGRSIGGRVVQGSSDLADVLLEQAGVAVVPGAVFGDDRCIRMSFASSLAELEQAMERIRAALA
jgi:aspartate aminotransferase